MGKIMKNVREYSGAPLITTSLLLTLTAAEIAANYSADSSNYGS